MSERDEREEVLNKLHEEVTELKKNTDSKRKEAKKWDVEIDEVNMNGKIDGYNRVLVVIEEKKKEVG